MKNSGKNKRTWLATFMMMGFALHVFAGGLATTTAKDDLEKAKKAGNAVFLVISGSNAQGTDDLIKVANDATKQIKKSCVVQMNKDDASNKEVVTKFGLAGVPPPFILVISPKGHAVGGYTKEHATVDNLIRVIPSAKYDEVLDAINNKKPVFVVAARKSFTDKPAVLAECKNAAGKIPASASIVEIDMDDEQEAGFLKQIGVNTVATNTVTVVINATGNITGNFTGKQDAQALAAAANRVIKSCCPGGSSSGCAPPKK